MAQASTFIAVTGQEVNTISRGGHWNLYDALAMVGTDHPDSDWNDANDYFDHQVHSPQPRQASPLFQSSRQ